MASAIRLHCVRMLEKKIHNFYCVVQKTPFHFQFHTSTLYNGKGIDVRMPSLSPTMTVGTILKWYKKEGDIISPGDVLCDIQTDKAVMSFETEEEGVLAKILKPEGTTEVHVGTLIGLIAGEGEDWKNIEISGNSAQNIGVANGSKVHDDSESMGSQKLLMPSLSPTMTEGTIIKWHKKEGDFVAPGDILCDIQTDKAVMGFETEEEGILAKILIEEGTPSVKVGSLLAVMVPEGTDWSNVKIPSSNALFSGKTDDDNFELELKKNVSNDESSRSETYGPAVRILLELYQIDSSKVVATGKNRKLLKSDLLNYIAVNKLRSKPLIPVPLPKISAAKDLIANNIIFHRQIGPKYCDIELSSMRKTIANRLIMSKRSIPHAYAAVSCKIDELSSLRKQMKSAGIRVSINDFFIKAVALALSQCPHMNKLCVKGEVVTVSDIDISIAVATDSGLITPIIKKANEKSVSEISKEMKELAQKARQGKLQLHEFQGGSFTISNLGMFAISEFSAIINPPQCAILAVGGGLPFIETFATSSSFKKLTKFFGKLHFCAGCAGINWTYDTNKNICTKVTSTLSYDSRAISESAAADFLENVQWLLHNPINIVMGLTAEVAKTYAYC